LNKSISSLSDRISSLQDQMTQIEARYRAQFTSLDTYLSQWNTTGSYLTQQLSKLSSS